MSHKISQFTMNKDYIADITFFNGEKRQCNMKILIETYPELASKKGLLKRLSQVVIEKSKNGISLPEGGRIDCEELWGNGYYIGMEKQTDPVISFANALIDAREVAGFSQRELEEKSGVRQAEISKIERGEGNPSLRTMGKLFSAMGRDLVFGERKIKNELQDYIPVNEAIVRYLNPAKMQGDYTIEDMEALPEDARVELIDGVIYDMSVPTLPHQLITNAITNEFNKYIDKRKGECLALTGPTGVWFEEDDRDLLVPDMLVVCDKKKLDRKGIVGAPDFVLEVLSSSTRNRDLSIKLKKYKEKGVREYWMIDPHNRKLIVYDFSHTDIPCIYGLEEKVKVGIYEGKLVIDLKKVCQGLEIE